MSSREPVAFLSYVRSDDDHDGGRVTELRKRLEGEVKMQTGVAFPIFQDRNDILWGQRWKERIESTVLDVTFLIPIVTPSYFRSEMCRKEFETFLIREKTLGEDRLILPIYYVKAKEMEEAFPEGKDVMADVLRTRNWSDWRGHRFGLLDGPELRAQIASLATVIGSAMDELTQVFKAASESTSKQLPPRPPSPPPAPPVSMVGFSPKVEVIRNGPFSKERLDTIQRSSSYWAYTKAYDEVISPAVLAEAAETVSLQALLLKKVSRVQKASKNTILDALNAIGANVDRKNLTFSILLDNSGSLRDKVANLAAWITVTSELLQMMGVRHEVLGYTTRAWKGGKSREMWLDDGRPSRPGRVNDVRYLVYKSFETTFQEAQPNYAIMLREGVLKENIDGEAVLFAHDRLADEIAPRKILLVVSDGAPVDDSTQSVNDENFLRLHLLQSVDWVKSQPGIEVVGAGIGHETAPYFRDTGVAMDPERFGPQLLKLVVELIKADARSASATILQHINADVQARRTKKSQQSPTAARRGPPSW